MVRFRTSYFKAAWSETEVSEQVYFIGKLEESSFKVRRKIHYRNSFLPEIVGQLERLVSETKINITLRLPLFAKISAVIPISVLLFAAVTEFLAEKDIASAF